MAGSSLFNRIQLALALLIVFLLVFATNRIDKSHFESVQNTVNSVYKDRVVAQDYIFNINRIINEKEISLYLSEGIKNDSRSNGKLNELVDNLENTKLTEKEKLAFIQFKRNLSDLAIKEKNYDSSNDVLYNSIKETYKSIHANLNTLADIQVQESKELTRMSNKTLKDNAFISQLEVIFLIVIGIVFQFVIFYRWRK